MGLSMVASLLCDNCNVTQVNLQSADSPLPTGWLRVQGYVNLADGSAEVLNGYFCAVCKASQGTRTLVKKAADISEDLTLPEGE